MSRPALEALRLQRAFVDSEADRSAGPLRLQLDLDELLHEALSPERFAVSVGLTLELADPDSGDTFCELSAELRLVYRGAPPDDLPAQRAFSVAWAVPEAWPVWRAWVQQTLALMGLPPAPLPPRVPDKLMMLGEEAFDLSRQVDERLAQRRSD
ncbi:MAG: hypothetical protein H6739_33400 [Alphaproteobacteria bacterium]|nr:hypothetical protein [Alphaproteobacteria bacterium]